MNNSEQLRDVYRIVTNRIIEQLEKGVVPWRQSWTEAGLPQNLITRKPYRGINTMLLASYNYERNFFLTFKQVSELGGKVKKGEKAHPVVFWNWVEQINEEFGETEKIPFLKYYLVFNVAQCEGIPEDKIPTVENRTHSPIDQCEEVITAMPDRPQIQFLQQRAFYQPFQDFINMPKKETFENAEEYYGTLFHELVHSTGHHSRLSRKSLIEMSEFGSNAYSFEELIAETGACYLTSHTGISNEVFENSVAYIQGWLQVFKNNSKFVVQASTQAQKAVDFILNNRQQEDEKQEEKVPQQTTN